MKWYASLPRPQLASSPRRHLRFQLWVHPNVNIFCGFTSIYIYIYIIAPNKKFNYNSRNPLVPLEAMEGGLILNQVRMMGTFLKCSQTPPSTPSPPAVSRMMTPKDVHVLIPRPANI